MLAVRTGAWRVWLRRGHMGGAATPARAPQAACERHRDACSCLHDTTPFPLPRPPRSSSLSSSTACERAGVRGDDCGAQVSRTSVPGACRCQMPATGARGTSGNLNPPVAPCSRLPAARWPTWRWRGGGRARAWPSSTWSSPWTSSTSSSTAPSLPSCFSTYGIPLHLVRGVFGVLSSLARSAASRCTW